MRCFCELSKTKVSFMISEFMPWGLGPGGSVGKLVGMVYIPVSKRYVDMISM